MPPKKSIAPRSRGKKIINKPKIEEPKVIISPVFEETAAVPVRVEDPVLREFNPTPRFYRTIALSFLSIAVILVGGVFIFTLGKAEINLSLKPKTVNIDTLLAVSEKAGDSDGLNGLVVELPLTETKEFAVEGSGEGTPAQAVGKVTIYNNTGRNQTLVAPTRLLSADNILFRMKKTLVILAEGKAISDVYADKPGAEGNIGPSKFTIPGLSQELQKSIYAESAESMLGGIKYVKILAEEDIKKAQDILVADLLKVGETKIKETLGSSSTFYNSIFSTDITTVKSEPKVGESVDRFKLFVLIKVTGVFYNSADLDKKIADELRSSLSENEVVLGAPAEPMIVLNKIDSAAKTAEIRVTQTVSAQVSYLEDVINKNQILGRRKSEVESYLKTLPWIDNVEIKTSPSWISKLPNDLNKIKIKVQ